jgi:hypothetical protein
MNNLKRDLKSLSRARREIYKEEDLAKIGFNNLERLGVLTKAKEDKYFKKIKALKKDLEAIDSFLNDLFLEAQAQGVSVEDFNIINLQCLDELDLEEKQG